MRYIFMTGTIPVTISVHVIVNVEMPADNLSLNSDIRYPRQVIRLLIYLDRRVHRRKCKLHMLHNVCGYEDSVSLELLGGWCL